MISKELYYIHGGYTPGWCGVGAAVLRPTTFYHILKNHITLSSFWCKKLDIRGGTALVEYTPGEMGAYVRIFHHKRNITVLVMGIFHYNVIYKLQKDIVL
jgi:hypothetical protein